MCQHISVAEWLSGKCCVDMPCLFDHSSPSVRLTTQESTSRKAGIPGWCHGRTVHISNGPQNAVVR